MSELLLTMPAYRSPLVLRTTGKENAIRAAEGFGARVTSAQLDQVQADMFAAYASARPHAGGSPGGQQDPVGLRQPDMDRIRQAAGEDAQRLTNDALKTLLMARLWSKVSDSSLDSLRQRWDVLRAQRDARAAQAGALAASVQAALEAAMAAQDAADAAIAEHGEQEGALEAARQEVERLQAELDTMQPDDPGYAAKQAELTAAQAAQQQAQGRHEAAAKALFEAAQTLDGRLGELDAERARAEAFNAGQPLGVDPSSAKAWDAQSTLVVMMGMLFKLINDGIISKHELDTAYIQKTIEARHAQERERIRQHDEQIQRARDAEKKTGCAGKILGWIGAAVGVVASVAAIVVGALHGNVALIAGGVMGMMLTIDSIVGMTTGFSVVGKAIEGLGKVIANALIAFGVPEDTAKQVGAIMATVAVIVAIVAVMMVTGNIAAAGRSVAGGVGTAKAAVDSTLTAARVIEQGSRVLQFVAQATGAIGQIVQNAGQLVMAGMMLEAAKLFAAVLESMSGNEILLGIMRSMGEAMALWYRSSMDLMVQTSQVNDDRAETGRHIISHIRNRA
ncbi:MAG: type III secretion system translocon subunit SctE [Stenotrophomonas sp.]|uniref:type III secretion system translocon subunit SctE n=1 Tax=Stenotrophomonas sp. TaxID=69392 RepID=UPI0029ABDB8A|nr:type III secretion system translocon subunit SctE [Stenotrophomonas sp.]MDX3932432.1 type III secretion system translocon subunit SctE [Stenotrophomonas sp.]